ncbi:Amino-acid acetyltransferase [Nymphon striatum]|nr:Amino-acid acetyltransferase [Nymphon striatum]
MGMDAYTLASSTESLKSYGSSINGKTGTISLDKDGSFHRKSRLARFNKGVAMPFDRAIKATMTETLVFIEVRYRKNADFGGAAASVTPKKQQRIIKAALAYQQQNAPQSSMRFDVVAIEGDNIRNNPKINWIENAEAAPYIHKHRGKIFVIAFAGEVIECEEFSQLIEDIAILSALGTQIVLVHGARPQVDRQLKAQNHDIQVVDDMRVTDDLTLQVAKEAIAKSLQADKLVFIHENAATPTLDVDLQQLDSFIDTHPDQRRLLNHIKAAMNDGVERVHLVSTETKDGLLLELYTRDGIGTIFKPFLMQAFQHVINLAMHDSDNALPEEGSFVAEAGMNYFHIPVSFEAPTEDHLRLFLKQMRILRWG